MMQSIILLSAVCFILADGSEAYEMRITWRYEGRTRLNTLVLSALRENKLINNRFFARVSGGEVWNAI